MECHELALRWRNAFVCCNWLDQVTLATCCMTIVEAQTQLFVSGQGLDSGPTVFSIFDAECRGFEKCMTD